jgi:hypothetical protein
MGSIGTREISISKRYYPPISFKLLGFDCFLDLVSNLLEIFPFPDQCGKLLCFSSNTELVNISTR